MTRKEAIEVLRKLPIGLMDLSYEQKSDLTEALNIALAALRGPTREQVEAFPKCNYCEAEWGTCNPITNRFTMPPRGGIRFCPMCGHPMTDEAVEITLRRLEALKDGTTD